MAKTNVKVELFYSAAWHDITATEDVYTRDPITITRGRPDEVSAMPPSTLNLTINNRDGMYSPRNPRSPLYRLIGRNTPIRVSVNGGFRFHGEVESWPQRWTVDGKDVWVPIVANGIRRRLNAPGTTQPSLSPLYRTITGSATKPWAYWPMESEDKGDTAPGDVLASPIDGVPPLIQFARGAQFGKGLAGLGSAGVPDFRRGGTLTANIPDDGLFVATDGYTLEFVARYDNNTTSVPGLAIRWYSPGSDPTFWDMNAGPNMDLFFGNDSVFQGSATSGIYAHDGVAHHYRVTAQQSGGNILIKLYRDGVLVDNGDDFGGGDPVVTGTLNRPTRILVSHGNGGAPNNDQATGIGHVTLWHGVTPPVDTVAAATAYVGETAAARINRLCTEAGIPITIEGTAADSEKMGVQRVAPLLELLDDAAAADAGILYEARDSLGFTYRVHRTLYNQAAVATLNYAAGSEVAPPLDPVEDTDHIGNDITVERVDGNSARAVQETGTLNVKDPTADPDGVGRYPKSYKLALFSDDRCFIHATWRRHLGTWDEARYPVVPLDLTAMTEAGKTVLRDLAASIDVGDKFAISNAPTWLPPELIEQHAQGFAEIVGSHHWTMAINATPAGPYQVGILDSTTAGRLDSRDTTLNEVLDTTETGVDVISVSVPWSLTAVPYDVMINGERMTVTSVAGAGLTQTFTVVRSVNGIVKTHPSGVPVRLFRPFRLAR